MCLLAESAEFSSIFFRKNSSQKKDKIEGKISRQSPEKRKAKAKRYAENGLREKKVEGSRCVSSRKNKTGGM